MCFHTHTHTHAYITFHSKSLTRVQSNPNGKSFIIEVTAGLSNVLLLVMIIIISSVSVCLISAHANAKFILVNYSMTVVQMR